MGYVQAAELGTCGDTKGKNSLGSSPSPVFPSYDKYYKIPCPCASVSLSVDGAGHSPRFLDIESGK